MIRKSEPKFEVEGKSRGNKGTGRARHSSRRSPIWKGGGTTFGPHPRDYDTNLPNSMKQAALVSALSLKNKEENILFLENADLTQPKTKELIGVIDVLGLKKFKILFVVEEMNQNLKRASSNLRDLFAVRLARDVNAYHIQRRRKLLIEKEALPILEKRALGESLESASESERQTS
jgi:large subunit ribosomal protein L4